MSKKFGLFITIEGIEGVGKSTALEFIMQQLNQYQIQNYRTREPGGTEISEAIRQVLLHSYQEKMCEDTELLLMFASRAQHLHQVIFPQLAAGTWVICDRFTDASYAYQGGGRKILASRIAILEQWVQNDFVPDCTFLLDAPVEIALQRLQHRGSLDRVEAEGSSFFAAVRENYLLRAKQFPDRFIVIDASLSLPEVQRQIKQGLEKLITHV